MKGFTLILIILAAGMMLIGCTIHMGVGGKEVMHVNSKKVILDTDIGPDCDDAGAMAVLHALADMNEVEILAVCHCTTYREGASCIDAINRYYGRPDIPVGTLKGPGIGPESYMEKFNTYLAQHYENAFADKPAEDAVVVYRRILSAQPDGSVIFIAIGPLTNLANLLQSGPDEISPLDGLQLVKSKINKLVLMGGNFQGDAHGEWNIVMDIPSAKYVAEQWPTPMVYSPFEVGFPVITGKRLIAESDTENPVRMAYELFCGSEGRNSWDLATVFFAVRGTDTLFKESTHGKIVIDEKGRTMLTDISYGDHWYIENAAPTEQIADTLEELLLKKPVNKK